MRQFALVCLLGLLAACAPSLADSGTPAVTATPDLEGEGAECFQPPYPPPVGLEIGGRGQVADGNFALDLSAQPHAQASAQLEPLETFTVLEGPVCWYIPQNPTHHIEYRGWRVRSESRDLEGWIPDYLWGFTTSIVYQVRPLEFSETGAAPGRVLPAPVTFEGSLKWTSFGGPLEPRSSTHTLILGESGYLTFQIEADFPDLVNPDLEAGSSPCRVIALVDNEKLKQHLAQPQVIGSQLQIGREPVDRLWVEPGEYYFTVMLVWVTNVGDWDETVKNPTCPDTSYTLTVTPVTEVVGP